MAPEPPQKEDDTHVRVPSLALPFIECQPIRLTGGLIPSKKYSSYIKGVLTYVWYASL